jgi:putative transposase
MPFRTQAGSGGIVFHVLNRGARRLRLFDAPDDYRAFLHCLARTRDRIPLRILAYCVMPNHFHLVVWPTQDGELARFMHRMTSTHAKRWHVRRDTSGDGAVYQSRYKALAVQGDRHFLTVCRYVERNALSAGLVQRAEEWPWSSLAESGEGGAPVPIDDWPVQRPPDWPTLVNETQFASELEQVRQAVRSGLPLGDTSWAVHTARRLGLEAKPPGRPRKCGQ